jgi:hypothetical protein
MRSGAVGYVAAPELTSVERYDLKLQLAWQHVDIQPAPCLDLELICAVPDLQVPRHTSPYFPWGIIAFFVLCPAVLSNLTHLTLLDLSDGNLTDRQNTNRNRPDSVTLAFNRNTNRNSQLTNRINSIFSWKFIKLVFPGSTS